MGNFVFAFTAMKKRSRESVSPPLPEPKKLNNGINGVDTPPKGGVKKSKLNLVSHLPKFSFLFSFLLDGALVLRLMDLLL